MSIHPDVWKQSCTNSEATLHQISPYIGKLKSSIARELIASFTSPGQHILDPFVGAGTVALESLLLGRNVMATDTNPYAVVLTRAKMFPPRSAEIAIDTLLARLKMVQEEARQIDTGTIPLWVASLFHPRTLTESLALARILKSHRDYFLLGCLLGILHHQRPGFLSYPSSHLVPYLRSRKFPRGEYPELYGYRDLTERLIAKIKRVYKRPSPLDSSLSRKCLTSDARRLHLPEHSIDAVITSPPYMNALDYYRDNRVRLWFLGVRRFDPSMEVPRTSDQFSDLMLETLGQMARYIKPGGKCVLVVGDSKRSGRSGKTVSILLDHVMPQLKTFQQELLIEDEIPDIRRSRRECRCTKSETIMVFSVPK